MRPQLVVENSHFLLPPHGPSTVSSTGSSTASKYRITRLWNAFTAMFGALIANGLLLADGAAQPCFCSVCNLQGPAVQLSGTETRWSQEKVLIFDPPVISFTHLFHLPVSDAGDVGSLTDSFQLCPYRASHLQKSFRNSHTCEMSYSAWRAHVGLQLTSNICIQQQNKIV